MLVSRAHGMGLHLSNLGGPLYRFFPGVSQDALATFPVHKLPFKILVHKLFVTRVN